MQLLEKRLFIREDWLSLWIGLFVFILSLEYFLSLNILKKETYRLEHRFGKYSIGNTHLSKFYIFFYSTVMKNILLVINIHNYNTQRSKNG